MPLKLTTWNINSVRLRIALVERFLSEEAPDVLCLQETKCCDADFPLAAFHAAGYPHLAINGQKGYHGVAIASRLPFARVERRGFCGKSDARHVMARVQLGPEGAGCRAIDVHNLYVPAGGDEPDPLVNPKFAHKLDFLREMAAWIAADGVAAGDAVLVGDLNVSPGEHDVWSHRALINTVCHTPVEVELFARVQAAGGFLDVMRRVVPDHEKCYTWWSYRAADWLKADRGRRLDHVWASPSLGDSFRAMTIHKASRGWDRPSDHVPVTAVFEV